MWLRSVVLACVAANLVGHATAQTDPTNVLHQLVRVGEPVASPGSGLFGDRVNHYTGALSFTQTDVAVPGNSLLPVALTRKYIAGGMVAFTRFSVRKSRASSSVGRHSLVLTTWSCGQ